MVLIVPGMVTLELFCGSLTCDKPCFDNAGSPFKYVDVRDVMVPSTDTCWLNDDAAISATHPVMN